MFLFLEHLILTAVLLLLVANLVSGVHVQGWSSALIGAVVLGFVNAVVRPLMVLLTLPSRFLPLGSFSWWSTRSCFGWWRYLYRVSVFRVLGPHSWGAWCLSCSILPLSFSYSKLPLRQSRNLLLIKVPDLNDNNRQSEEVIFLKSIKWTKYVISMGRWNGCHH
jgi:uncharacterized membrane protein YvlD (DUF360 family)